MFFEPILAGCSFWLLVSIAKILASWGLPIRRGVFREIAEIQGVKWEP